MSSWPASSLIKDMSVPLLRRVVQYVCRKMCGVIFFVMPDRRFSAMKNLERSSLAQRRGELLVVMKRAGCESARN